MRRARLFSGVACVALASAFPAPARAQPVPPTPVAPAGPLAAGVDAANRADYAAAEKALASVQGADRAQALATLGRVMLEQGHFAEAERDAVAAQSGATEDVRLGALALRGEILAAQGKVDEAIRLLTPAAGGNGVGARRVRLELGELLIRAGRRADAEPFLLKFADEYGSDAISSADAEGLAMVGRAMHLLRHPKDANTAYNESERAEVSASGGALHGSARVQTLLWRADLYIDKYDPGHAEQVLNEALKIAPHDADANVALARVKLEEALDFDAAEKLATPGARGEPASTRGRTRSAPASRSATWTCPPPMPPSTRASRSTRTTSSSSALRAAARFLADDRAGLRGGEEATVLARTRSTRRVLRDRGRVRRVGAPLRRHRRHDEERPSRSTRSDGKAWAELGLTLMRAGDETGGRAGAGASVDEATTSTSASSTR